MFHPVERIALAAWDRPVSGAEWLRLVDDLHADPGFWWLDSALEDGRLGRFSFAGADPYLILTGRATEAGETRVEIDVRREVRAGLDRGFHRIDVDPIETARTLLPRADSLVYSTRTSSASGNPRWHEVQGLSAGLDLPFLGGAVGYFGYEFAAVLADRVRFENEDELGLPDLFLSFVDRVLAFDVENERLWIFGLGFGDARSTPAPGPREAAVSQSRAVVDEVAERVEALLARSVPLRRAEEASPLTVQMNSTVDASGYCKAVDTVLEEIAAGNVYQVNFSQRFAVEASIRPFDLYRRLREHNAAPFGAYLALRDAAILSSSPERFLRVDENRRVESRPIKGTRPRGADAEEDRALRDDLASSEKDRAENLMIVDLVRNDLGRVCAPGSIAVPELMAIEPYAAVLQMVSTVTGDLATGRDAFDLLHATFPPGSMTGAPKLAAMNLIESLEEVRRSVYSGALGYFDVRGGLDLSVVIRTLVYRGGRASLHVGGGIVADSSPEAEYVESLDKARAPLAALGAEPPEVDA